MNLSAFFRTKMYQDELIEEKMAEVKKESKSNEVEILELSSPVSEPKKNSKKRKKFQKGSLTTKEPDTTEPTTTSKETSTTTTTTTTTNEATTTTTTTTTSTTTTVSTNDDTPAPTQSTVTDISAEKELEPGLPESPKRKTEPNAAGDWLRARTCQGDENVFFLKTSKTGSQTLMAIMQRFGIRHNSTFLLAENMNGALSQLHTPISQDRDCWVGKHLGMKFNISTQHLKYNRELINSIMIPGHKKISIIRKSSHTIIFSYTHNINFYF